MSTDEDSTKFWTVFSLDNQREYCSGEKRALIRTIVTCSQFNVKLPAWAREAIVEAYISLPRKTQLSERRVGYRVCDVEEWLDRRRQSTEEQLSRPLRPNQIEPRAE